MIVFIADSFCESSVLQKIWYQSVQGEAKTETDKVATAARNVPVTRGRAAIHRNIEPRTTMQHTDVSCIRPFRINYVIWRIIIVKVLAPLPKIAVHVI